MKPVFHLVISLKIFNVQSRRKSFFGGKLKNFELKTTSSAKYFPALSEVENGLKAKNF